MSVSAVVYEACLKVGRNSGGGGGGGHAAECEIDWWLRNAVRLLGK